MNRRVTGGVIAFAVLGAAFQTLPAAPAHAQAMVRDAEVEHTIREWARPLFAAAELDPSNVRIHLVLDPGVNAFVAGGQRVFLYTGLLLAAETPMQLLGVIAHETGHVAAGHLARTHAALRQASARAVLGFLLGAAAIVAGAPDAGAAAILGGQQAAERAVLSYSRAQESTADVAAVRLMLSVGYPPGGLVDFLEVLAGRERLLDPRPNPYTRSHPLFPERIAAVRAAAAAAGPAALSTPQGWTQTWDRLQAKLYGFVEDVNRVLRRYPLSDTSVLARVARAVAFEQAGRLNDALSEIDALLAVLPNDPYLWELRGQALLHYGRVGESIPAYRLAVDLLPGEPQFRVGLATALVAAENQALLPEAIRNLTAALSEDRTSATAWRQLALARGRSGDTGQAALATAEQNLVGGADSLALRFAGQALQLLPKGSPGWLRAEDIRITVLNRAER